MDSKSTGKTKIKGIALSVIQFVLVIVGIYYLFMFAAPVFGIIFNIGSVLGTILSLALILTGVFLKRAVLFCKKYYKIRKGKIILNTGFFVLAIGIIAFSATLGSVTLNDNTNAENEDTVIVLGCAVMGETPSVTLRSRINAAYNYLEENPDAVAVLSGGQGVGESISEAQCMFNVLTEMGIDESRLFLENKSRNTSQNIEFSAGIIEENKLSKNVAVATSDYHLKRAVMICEKNGLKARRISAPSTFFDKPTFYLREVLGVAKEFLIR